MASPTTIKIDNRPATPSPTAQKTSFKNHDTTPRGAGVGSGRGFGGLGFLAEGGALVDIGRLVVQPTGCGPLTIIKIPHPACCHFAKKYGYFGFQKIATSADSCYKTPPIRPKRGKGGDSMQSWTQRWWPWALGPARHAWGLAPQGGAWALVGLTRLNPRLARVHTRAVLQGPEGPDDGQVDADLTWLSRDLHLHGLQRKRWRHRLNVALPEFQLREGFIDCPVELNPDEWVFEVLTEASQALQLPSDAVSFDYSPTPMPDGAAHRVFWIACPRVITDRLKNCTRAAGWRLAAVECEAQAAERALRSLQGGVASVLTQAPKDWLFDLPPAGSGEKSASFDLHLEESDQALAQVLAHVKDTTTGTLLVACGLALRTWS
jgi:hypothetical protein